MLGTRQTSYWGNKLQNPGSKRCCFMVHARIIFRWYYVAIYEKPVNSISMRSNTRNSLRWHIHTHKKRHAMIQYTLCICILHLKGSKRINTHLRSRKWGTLQKPALLQVPFFNLLSRPTKSKSLCIQVSPRTTHWSAVSETHPCHRVSDIWQIKNPMPPYSPRIQWFRNGIKVSTGDSSFKADELLEIKWSMTVHAVCFKSHINNEEILMRTNTVSIQCCPAARSE